MTEYGIFNDESADWTASEAVEADFYSRQEAEDALRERYNEDDSLTIHEVEEEEEEDEDVARGESPPGADRGDSTKTERRCHENGK